MADCGERRLECQSRGLLCLGRPQNDDAGKGSSSSLSLCVDGNVCREKLGCVRKGFRERKGEGQVEKQVVSERGGYILVDTDEISESLGTS